MCEYEKRSVSSPSISKVADFLLYLQKERRPSVSAVKDYRSTLASVYPISTLPEHLQSTLLSHAKTT